MTSGTKPFQSLNRAYKRSDLRIPECLSQVQPSFNPSIGLTSVPTKDALVEFIPQLLFQSLNRAYKRSDTFSAQEVARL